MNTATASRPWAELSSVLVKVGMALSGLGMASWLTLHMAGNLLWFLGPEAINRYGGLLHGSGLLWPVRLLLVGGFAVHVAGALLTTRRARAARPVRYKKTHASASSWASRSMRLTGVALLGFTAYHVASVYGMGRPEPSPHTFHQNLSELLQRPWDASLLAASAGLIALHLSHGLASAFVSLGWIAPRHEAWLRRTLNSWAVVLTVGFALLPALGWLLV